MSRKAAITLNINGRGYPIEVEPRRTLADAIREDCGQTGTHIGCEHGICGACTVIVERRTGALLPDVRRAGRRQKDQNRRGSGAGRQAAPDAAGLHGPPRPAVRFLHAGFFDAGGRRAGARTRHQRRRPASTCFRRICVVAPAIRTSSRQSAPRQKRCKKGERLRSCRLKGNLSAVPSRVWRIALSSPARAALQAISHFPASGICASCARRSRTGY